MDIRYLGASKRYSEAVVANGLVFLSGMVPENPEADAKAQTENVLAQIDSWLAQCQSAVAPHPITRLVSDEHNLQQGDQPCPRVLQF